MKTRYVLLLASLLLLTAWPVEAQRRDRPSPMLNYLSPQTLTAGDGYMVAGQLWDTVKPMNSASFGTHDPAFASLQATRLVNIGADQVDWRAPVGMWPGGYDQTDLWRNSRRMAFPVFREAGWPGYDGTNPLKTHDASTDNRFMFPFFTPNVAGANDATRNYKRAATFTDQNRVHMVYEAGWPTTAGIDFKLRAHQYTVNEQNLNDFVVLEISLTNTGNVDINGNGTIDITNNVIDGIAPLVLTLPTHTVEIGRSGDRSANRFGAGRTYGYFATPDENGAPYDMIMWYPNVPPDRSANRGTPAAGRRLIGVNDGATLRGYQDRWHGFRFMGVKQGAIGDNLAGPTAASPDKETVFGTHPIGDGQRRGWYTSSHKEASLLNLFRSDMAFRSATATWYADYGRSTTTANANLNPNPAFFTGGTADNVNSFVVGNPNARPNGDFKYASQDRSPGIGITQPVWEDRLNPRAAQGDFYDGAVGFNWEYTFAEPMYQGIGPFRLAVGESITLTYVVAAGYRFEGLWNAVRAAEWAWGHGWDIQNDLPVPPAPDMVVESTADATSLIRWTDVAGVGNQVDGYKIWRASQFKRTPFRDEGFRILNRYHHQHEVGPRPEAVKDPINPYMDAWDEFRTEIQGSYQPSEWGPYELVQKIPVGQLGTVTNPGGGFQFAWEDTDAITGFTYWYYVSAYREGQFSGPLGAVPVGHIESSNFNRNGRNGRGASPGEISLASPWIGTYPFSDLNALFPQRGTPDYKNIGAAFTLTPPVAPVDEVAQLITVTPNPYKRTGLNDRRQDASSHDIDFLNLPDTWTLTIIDVAGQIIFQTNEQHSRVVEGRFTWDMFSKDGVEVSSGVYIYHLAYGEGREVTGHFAILR